MRSVCSHLAVSPRMRIRAPALIATNQTNCLIMINTFTMCMIWNKIFWFACQTTRSEERPGQAGSEGTQTCQTLSLVILLLSSEQFYSDCSAIQKDEQCDIGIATHSMTKGLKLVKNIHISGYGVRRWCKILQPGCPRLTSAMRIGTFSHQFSLLRSDGGTRAVKFYITAWLHSQK